MSRTRTARFALVPVALSAVLLAAAPLAAQEAPRLFLSVDMEGIGGIGTPEMTSTGGKDYATGRRLLTDEVNAVTEAIYAIWPNAEILVNDSHGDHQNVLHTELDPRVTYIQGSIKPLGMVQGLDGTFDGAKLVEKLKAIKKDNPDQRAITVMAEDSIQYESLVLTVDKCLEADLPDVSVSAAM